MYICKFKVRGFNSQVVGNKELKNFHPYLKTEDLEGAIWVPEDAVANPQAVCEVLAKLAKEGGMCNPAKFWKDDIVWEVFLILITSL
jgi:glycine/D-amino acid oxidase-like deaminating enzyme